jgi:hypothetical protein
MFIYFQYKPIAARSITLQLSQCIIIIIFLDQVIRGLFQPLEEYADLFDLTVGGLHFVFSLGFMLEFSLEIVCFPFIARDISIVIWIL